MKHPEDRKASKREIAEAQQKEFSQLEGADLLKPFSKLKAQDVFFLTGNVLKIADPKALENENIDSDDIGSLLEILNLSQIPALIDAVESRFVIDAEGWEEFNTAENADKVLNLVMTYFGEMGKGKA